MKKSILSLSLLAFVVIGTACTTTTKFQIPANSTLTVYGRTAGADAQGVTTVRPFFWNTAGGVDFTLADSTGKVVRHGKLKTKFRVVSIFWPPGALIYWPMGFGSETYDLTKPADGFLVREAPKAAPLK